jgi:hypothetical protein
MLFDFALEYAVREVQENQVGWKSDETHDLLANADDVKLLGDSLDAIKNTETVIDASKDIRLEVNSRRIYVVVSSPEYRTKP